MSKWLESEIMMVGATAARFPNHQVLHWIAARGCIDTIHSLLRTLNDRFAAIEVNRDLSVEGRARQLAEAASSALGELEDWPSLTKARSQVAQRIENLKTKTSPLPAEPKSAAEIAVAAEIRRWVGEQDSPADSAWSQMRDPRVVAAILGAPAFVSGLTDEVVNDIRNAHIKSSHPDVISEISQLEKALRVLQGAINSAQQLIAKRASMRRDADGGWRSFNDAVPKNAA